MKTIRTPIILIGIYLFILLLLLLCVSTTPLLIRHGVEFNDRFMIEEEVLETAMIIALFVISFMILIHIKNRILACQEEADEALYQKSRLVSQLADAFRYIGKVNVEIQEIETALCDITFYPQTRNELRRLIDRYALKAMAIAGAPWSLARIIDRHSIQTVYEHAVRYPGLDLPSIAMGNRAILDGVQLDGLLVVRPSQQHPDLLSVIIIPVANLSKEENVMLTAILNQIEMLFIIYRAGCIKAKRGHNNIRKEIACNTNF